MARNTRSRRTQQTPQPLVHNNNTISTQTDGEEENMDGVTQPTAPTNGRPEQVEDIDSSDNEVYFTSKPKSSKSKPKLQIFKGIGDKVSIDNWLKRYEMIANYYKWCESDKLVMLGNYLEDDALNWYIENYDNQGYNELKCKLIARFGLETVEPIIEFVNLRYDLK